MKKIILSLGLLAGVAGMANAQEARFGIKAGVNLANQTNTDANNRKNLVGATAGLMADFSFSDLISLHPEVLFSQKGVKYEYGSTTNKSRRTYIDVPLLLRVKADGLFFEAGPLLASWLLERMRITTSSTPAPTVPARLTWATLPV